MQSTADGDSQAIYLLLSAVVHRQLLPDDATFAYTALTDCLLLESAIVSEMWVIPYCHYEVNKLLPASGPRIICFKILRQRLFF